MSTLYPFRTRLTAVNQVLVPRAALEPQNMTNKDRERLITALADAKPGPFTDSESLWIDILTIIEAYLDMPIVDQVMRAVENRRRGLLREDLQENKRETTLFDALHKLRKTR